MILNLFNLHTHSKYCDGTGEPEEFVLSAIEKDFHTLGFSSHAPAPFPNNFAIRDDQALEDYCRTIRGLRGKYQERISICLGLEIDYIEGISRDFAEFRESCSLDYTIGSVHLVRNGDDERLWFIDGARMETYTNGLETIFGGDVRRAVTAFYRQQLRMIETQKPDIIGHFDKIKMHNKGRYFAEEEPWYRDLVMELLEVIEESGVIVEVNTRGIYKKRSIDLYPGQWILKIMKEKGIRITLSSDAHRPEEMDGYYSETLEILRNIGFSSLVYYSDGRWEEQKLQGN
jgi:histidinol-phosphatase (PHP family)